MYQTPHCSNIKQQPKMFCISSPFSLIIHHYQTPPPSDTTKRTYRRCTLPKIHHNPHRNRRIRLPTPLHNQHHPPCQYPLRQPLQPHPLQPRPLCLRTPPRTLPPRFIKQSHRDQGTRRNPIQRTERTYQPRTMRLRPAGRGAAGRCAECAGCSDGEVRVHAVVRSVVQWG